MKDIRWHFFTFISNNTSQPHIKLCLTFAVSSFLWLLLALRLFLLLFDDFLQASDWSTGQPDVTLPVCTSADATKTLSKVPTWLWVPFAGFCSKTISFIYFMYQSAEEKTFAKWPADFLLFVAYCDFQRQPEKTDWLLNAKQAAQGVLALSRFISMISNLRPQLLGEADNVIEPLVTEKAL